MSSVLCKDLLRENKGKEKISTAQLAIMRATMRRTKMCTHQATLFITHKAIRVRIEEGIEEQRRL